MQLRDAGLGHAEHLADLAQRQLLVVVEGDDDLLALGKARDRLRHRLLRLRHVERGVRLRPLAVFDRVDEGDLVAGRRRHGPQLVESRDRRARDVEEALVELLLVDAELLGDLLVGGRAVELRLELRDRALDLAGARADGTRHPVHRPQLVDDRALDPGDRVRLELHVAVGVVALDRADEAQQAVRDEVVLVHVRREAARDAAGDELHERRVREDQPVAQRRVTGRAIRAPEGSGVVRHAERIRRASGELFF